MSNPYSLKNLAALVVISSVLLLSYASNPPTGYTGAPFDSNCSNCHGGGSYSGSVSVNGLPGTIQPNTVYNLDVTITSSNAPFGGYEMVVVDGANANCGNLTASGQSGTEFSGGREYVEQRGRKALSGGSVTWTFTWQSPTATTPVSGNQVKFYMAGNLVDGTGGTGGDVVVNAIETVAYAAASAISATITNTTNVTCFGLNNGSATVNATGGTGIFSYSWPNGQTGATATNLAPGNHTVTVTSGASTTTATATITQPSLLNASSSGGTISCANPIVNVTASASGGTSPYSFNWSNGGSGPTISVGAAGSYTAIVSDANGCTKSTTTIVSANITPPSANAGPVQILGAGGTATLNGTGSSTGAQYTYLWTTTGGNIQSGGSTLMPIVNAAGTYTLKVTNTQNGCTSTASTQVTAPATIPVAEAGPNITVTCLNNSGPIMLNGTGSSVGTEFAYLWNTTNGNISAGATTLMPTVTTSGTYGLVVTNILSGATATDVVDVIFNTQAPTVSVNGGTLTCTISCVDIIANGSTGVSYGWPNGSSSSTINVCSPGTYTVTATEYKQWMYRYSKQHYCTKHCCSKCKCELEFLNTNMHQYKPESYRQYNKLASHKHLDWSRWLQYYYEPYPSKRSRNIYLDCN